MPIVADVDDLAPAEMLMMLSASTKTGKVSATKEGSKIFLALQSGSIVYAASPTVRERVGSLLINRGLITEEQLQQALDKQQADARAPLLGSILVQMGAVSAKDLRDVISGQFEGVIRELLSWDSGVMIFESADLPEIEAVAVNPADVLVGIGVHTESLLVEELARMEMKRKRSSQKDAPPQPSPKPPQSPPQRAATGPSGGTREVMRSLSEETQSVSLTAEMTLAILGAASTVADRAVLFLVHPSFFHGVGGFGGGRDGVQVTGQRLQVPRDQPSLFATVVEGKTTFRGPVENCEGNRGLLEELGGAPPGDAVAVPLTVRDRVVAMLYADGGLGRSAIGPVEELEATMRQVAATLEDRGDASTNPSLPAAH